MSSWRKDKTLTTVLSSFFNCCCLPQRCPITVLYFLLCGVVILTRRPTLKRIKSHIYFSPRLCGFVGPLARFVFVNQTSFVQNPSQFNPTHHVRVHFQSSTTHPTCLYTKPSHSARPYLCSVQGLSMQRRISSSHLDPHRHGPYVLTSSRVSKCRRPSQLVGSCHRDRARESLISSGHPRHLGNPILINSLCRIHAPIPTKIIWKIAGDGDVEGFPQTSLL